MLKENGLRVVEGACHLSPSLGGRMVAADILDRSVFLHELSPHDLKLEINQFGCNEAMLAARFLGRIVGKAHARQMDVSARKNWRRQLLNGHSKTLDVPTWLGTSVVELVGGHEQDYLDIAADLQRISKSANYLEAPIIKEPCAKLSQPSAKE